MLDQMWFASQRYVRLFVSETVDDAMADHRELLVCCEQPRRQTAPPRSCAATSTAPSSPSARRSPPVATRGRELAASCAPRSSPPTRRRPSSASAGARAGRAARPSSSCSPRRSTRPISRSPPGRFRPEAHRFRTSPGSKASAASSSPVALRARDARLGVGSRARRRVRRLVRRAVRRRRRGARRGSGGRRRRRRRRARPGRPGRLDAALVARTGAPRTRSCSSSARRAAWARSPFRWRSSSARAASSPSGATADRLEAARRARRRCGRRASRATTSASAPRCRGRGRAADARARPALGAAARGSRGSRRPWRADRPSRPVGRADRDARLGPRSRASSSQILGYSNFAVPLDALARGYAEVVGHAVAGRIRLATEAVPLSRIGDAWARQRAEARRQARARSLTAP